MSPAPATEEQILKMLAMGRAGHSLQNISATVGFSRTCVFQILHCRARADVRPEVPRLPLPQKAEPRPRTGNCRTCNHWDESLFGQRERHGGPKERPNPCTVGVAEAGGPASYRFGSSCGSHTGLIS